MLFRLAVCLGFTSFASIAFAAKYEVVELGLFCDPADATNCGEYTYPYSINDSGTVVGHAQGWLVTTTTPNTDGTTTTTYSRKTHAFRWDNGVLSDLGDLGKDQSYAASINSAGDVVGHSVKVITPATETTSEVAQFRAFRRLSTDAEIQDIGVPTAPVNFMRALSVDDNGWIAGYGQVKVFADENIFYTRGFVWSPETMAITVLPALSDKTVSSLRAINSSAELAVGYSVKDGVNKAIKVALDAPTTLVELSALGGANSQANDVNASGKIVGWSWTSDNKRVEAFLYDAAATPVVTGLGQLGKNFRYSEAKAINNNNMIVGTAQASTGVVGYHAVIQDGNNPAAGWQDLNMLVDCAEDSAQRWTLTEALDINASGQIIGYGTKGGKTTGFLLKPISGNASPCSTAEPEFENQSGGGAMAILWLPILLWCRRLLVK